MNIIFGVLPTIAAILFIVLGYLIARRVGIGWGISLVVFGLILLVNIQTYGYRNTLPVVTVTAPVPASPSVKVEEFIPKPTHRENFGGVVERHEQRQQSSLETTK